MNKTAKKKFKIIDMHCTSCALTIDMDLEDLDGVTKAQTSYAKAECEVEFDSAKLELNILIETIKKSGYTAMLVDF